MLISVSSLMLALTLFNYGSYESEKLVLSSDKL